MRQAVPYFGGGLFGLSPAGKLQPVFVDDVATVFAEALKRDQTIQETYGLGGPEEFTWPGLYATIKKHLPGARDKCIIGIPAWKAKLLTQIPVIGPKLPFNWDQVVMSQEDSTCNIAKVRGDFGVEPVPFEETFAGYAGEVS
jgi:NADH dehydrogenase